MLRRLREGCGNALQNIDGAMFKEYRKIVESVLGDDADHDLFIVPHIAYGHSDNGAIKVYGNEGQAVNDCRPGDPGELNSTSFHVMYRGWPYVFLVTTKDIAAGQEIFLPYGEDYWKGEAIMHAKFRNTRSKIPISR
jgi:hypothetical protein